MIKHLIFIPLLLLLIACNKSNETNTDNVSISNAWVRENTPGQEVGAAYMTLESPTKTTLVYTEAIDAAGAVEIHSMTMNDGVMKMRMLEELPLEPNQSVSLKPGSFHLMLFDLKQPLTAGQEVKFRLCFKDDTGKITEQFVSLPVKSAE